MILHKLSSPEELVSAFELGPGYHGMTWVDLSQDEPQCEDPDVPKALRAFIGEVGKLMRRDDRLAGIGHIGCAYVRVVDAAEPENYMRWHRDNQDGGVRFHTASSSDGAAVNLAWPEDSTVEGQVVTDTDWGSAYQPANGVIVGFTNEVHGVVPQPERPDATTALFFMTVYPSREEADLYTTNNTITGQHAALPELELSVLSQ